MIITAVGFYFGEASKQSVACNICSYGTGGSYSCYEYYGSKLNCWFDKLTLDEKKR